MYPGIPDRRRGDIFKQGSVSGHPPPPQRDPGALQDPRSPCLQNAELAVWGRVDRMEPQYGRLKPPPEQVETGQVTLCRALGWWRNAHLSWSIAEGFVVGQLVQVGTLTKRP